ncbi:MAG: hypothetical protein PHQ40_00890 [Anaerolineaceae bacterium]|nr:hypothetical protein [Anaerolineaceae bacterium]
MNDHPSSISVYLEIGSKRTFAGAVDWPGWVRSGREEGAALAALLAYAPRYAKVLDAAGIAFEAPTHLAAFTISDHLPGNQTTDFGAPNVPLPSDPGPLEDAELLRLQSILKSCWLAFDAAVASARGKALRKGPRGGGRDLDGIITHLLEAERAYLGKIGLKEKTTAQGGFSDQLSHLRHAIMEELNATDRSGALPQPGPRGGMRWAPRTFIRRVAWHTLDHAWEVEDRIM